MNKIVGKDFKVLDKGYLKVIDVMGDDSAIVQSARVSYGKGTKTVNQDEGLIRYLIRNEHTSPLEMCEIKFLVKCPIFVARQWFRHRTGSFNEYSARYSEVKDDFYIPDSKRLQLQSKKNKQCSGEETLEYVDSYNFINDCTLINKNFQDTYNFFNKKGLAREINRINVPVSNYTEFYWKVDLNNLLKFVKLRNHSHSQYEIREYAKIIYEVIKEWTPLTYKAFDDYIINTVKFNKREMKILSSIIDREKVKKILKVESVDSQENKELEEKLKLLLLNN